MRVGRSEVIVGVCMVVAFRCTVVLRPVWLCVSLVVMFRSVPVVRCLVLVLLYWVAVFVWVSVLCSVRGPCLLCLRVWVLWVCVCLVWCLLWMRVVRLGVAVRVSVR